MKRKTVAALSVMIGVLLTGCASTESVKTVSSTTETTAESTTAITTTAEIVVESEPMVESEPTEEPAERTETAETTEQGTTEAEAPAEPAETTKPVETVAQTTKPAETTAQTTTATTKQTVSTMKVTTTTAKKPDPEPVIDIDLDAIKPNYVKTYPWSMAENAKGAYQPKYWDSEGNPTFKGQKGFDVTYLVGQDIPEGWYFNYPADRAITGFGDIDPFAYVYRLNGTTELYGWNRSFTLWNCVKDYVPADMPKQVIDSDLTIVDAASYVPFYLSKGDKVRIKSSCLIPVESAGYGNLFTGDDEYSFNVVGRKGCPIKAGVKYKVVPSKTRVGYDDCGVVLWGRNYNYTWYEGGGRPYYQAYGLKYYESCTPEDCSNEIVDPTVTLGDWVMQFKDGDIVEVHGAKLIPVDEATPEQMAFGVTTLEGEW